MDEFLAKKTGEVMAFSLSFLGTLEKGEVGFRKIFDNNGFDSAHSTSESFLAEIERIAEESEMSEMVEKKAVATGEKLKKMRDLYLSSDDDWNDPAELSEWMGFFLGAAYVHWSLVEGKSGEAEIGDLQELAISAMNFYEEALEEVAAFIKTV